MNPFFEAVYEIQEAMLMAGRAFRRALSKPHYAREIISQMDLIGVGSILIIVLTGAFTGGILALNTAPTLKTFGATAKTGQLVMTSLVREMGPVLASLMLAGRVGSAITAELGSMVVSEQVDAMRALGTDPIRKLVVPRMLSGFVMTPLLTVVADFVGIVGGWVVARFTLQVNSGLYWSEVTHGLFIADAWMGIIKPFVFGFIIVTIACHVGLRTSGGTAGVGKSTTMSVVVGSVAVIAADFFVTQILMSVLY